MKVWDVRSAQAVMELDHGAPVEALAFFPSGGLAVSAGGSYLCIWDVIRCGAATGARCRGVWVQGLG